MDSTSMSTQPTTPRHDSEREVLEKSERAASVDQPGSYKEKETDEKIVSIPPVGKDQKPIRGLDPV